MSQHSSLFGPETKALLAETKVIKLSQEVRHLLLYIFTDTVYKPSIIEIYIYKYIDVHFVHFDPCLLYFHSLQCYAGQACVSAVKIKQVTYFV